MEKHYIMTQPYLALNRILKTECQKKILGIGEKVETKIKQTNKTRELSVVLKY